MIEYLVQGSLTLCLIMDQILLVKIVKPLNPVGRAYQKLLVGESTPLCAWMIDIILQPLLIDARVFHSQLTDQERAEMARVLNDPKGTLKVLIMTYEVGAICLNLHEACDRVAITSIC